MSLDFLYEHLLMWDLRHLKHDHPRSGPAATALDKYKSSSGYVEIMEPLNLLECYASISRAFEEFRDQNKAKRFGGFPFKILDVEKGDENELFTEICMAASQQDIDDYELFNSTLVVITVPGSGETKCLGKIHSIKWNKETRNMNVWIRTRQTDLRVGSKWTCCCLTNMSTAERELTAVLGFADLALSKHILVGACSPFPKGSASDIQHLRDKYQGKLNVSQAEAVYGSMHARGGFYLIQGPPGTGKTSTIVSIIREQLQSGSNPLMFCAPSNAAVDELTKRLEKHMLECKLNYKILRIGHEDKVDPEVAHLTLGGMLRGFKRGEAREKAATDALATLVKNLEREIDPYYKSKDSLYKRLNTQTLCPCRVDCVRIVNDIKSEISVAKESIAKLYPKLFEQRANLWERRNRAKARREAFIKKVLQQSDIFCCTLSGSGSPNVQNSGRKFKTVIIDEAGQCTEPSSLIPLQYQCSKVILVGDPKQLPPTVLSSSAGNFEYDKSLFVRMLKANPEAMHTLDIQYRMHPDISLFPRTTFYNNVLKDGPGMAQKTSRQWHAREHLPPFRFFNVEGQHQFGDTKSLYNTAEIRFAERLFAAALQCGGGSHQMEIGIVSPYKQQVEKLKYHFSQRYDDDTFEKTLEIHTVDGFQGREKDIIILSCVRAHPEAHTVGFLADMRRLNVAITRAKASLWIIGNASTLVSNEKWQSLIRDANDRDMYCEASDFHMRQGTLLDSLGVSFEALGLE